MRFILVPRRPIRLHQQPRLRHTMWTYQDMRSPLGLMGAFEGALACW
jgi:hypothetical protein